MAKLTSYLKSLIPSEKSIRKLSHWENQIPISPKAQGDFSGIVLPRVTADSWSHEVDLEYLQRMFDCHDLVYNCINLVSQTFALARLRVKKKQPDGKYLYVPDHPIQRVLDNPNSSMTGYDLRQAFVVHRLLFGTVAFILLRNDMVIDNSETNTCPACMEDPSEKCWHFLWAFHKGIITQIMPVHLDRLSKKLFDTPQGPKEFFMYSTGEGRPKMPVHPDNILTDPNYNPAVSFYGSSPTARVQRWLEIDLGLSKQIGAYFMNNAIPSMLLNLKPPQNGAEYDKDPSELLNMMKENWMKKFSMAGDGYHSGREVKSPAFVYGDIQVQKIQDTLKDIVVKPLFYEIQSRIAMAYQVPRSLFEFGIDYGSQSATVKQQREDFFNDAISPQLDTFKSKMERYLLPSYEEEGLILEWDLTNMGVASFIEEKREAKWLKRWELGGITLDELRENIGLNPFFNEDEGNDRYRTSVMSDSSGNTQVNQNKPDNRLSNDPEVEAQTVGKRRNRNLE